MSISVVKVFITATIIMLLFGLSGEEAYADGVTVCSVDKICYCIQSQMKTAIDDEVTFLRNKIQAQKSKGKAIGYMSIPLSGQNGSYFPLNVSISAKVKMDVENRFGAEFAWVLNPIASDISLPQGASQADYMLMWTEVLEGLNGRGEDFDFIYFVGPADIAKYFELDGHADMQKLAAYYDEMAEVDSGLQKVDRKLFIDYYALRASVTFSVGAHDEWNVTRAINEARRLKAGATGQLAVLFDGRAVAPALYETAVAPGNAKPCDSR
jgi:hypothetical protein